jgi:NAD(P)-dependent dehydrogenase (short-subunit alcohol dehydrogenase family)
MAITLSYPDGGMLVTGGTGRVGKGIVRRLADAGVPIVFTYRGNAGDARATAAELCDAGHRVWAQQMDMTDSGSIQAALERVVGECGAIHGVALGAGQQVRFDKIADFPLDYVENFLNVDALGYYRVFHAAIPMLRASGGSITTCTTMATRRVIAYDGISPFSKGSIDALIRQVAAEEAEHRIRCNGVAIGWVEDRSIEEVRAWAGPKPEQPPRDEGERISVLMHQLFDLAKLGRPVTSEEAGNTFAFLASNEARHLTGQTLDLDAGCLL